MSAHLYFIIEAIKDIYLILIHMWTLTHTYVVISADVLQKVFNNSMQLNSCIIVHCCIFQRLKLMLEYRSSGNVLLQLRHLSMGKGRT